MISIPAVVAGNILQSDDTSVSVNDAGLDGHIVMKTQNTIAMIVNPDQSVSIGTELIESKLTINNNSPTYPTIRLSYLNSYFFDGRIVSNGNVLFQPSCLDTVADPDLTVSFKKNFDIADHNGTTRGLRLNGMLVTATATSLNYNDVSPGVGTAFKSLVLNGTKDITGISNLSATTLGGTLTTGPQWGITELDTVNIRTQLSLNGTPFTLTSAMMAYLDISTAGIAQPSKALVVDSSRNISNIGTLSATTLIGTLSTGPQPNITSLSALSTLNVNGASSFGSLLTITNASGNNLKIAYDGSNYATINASSTGELQLSTTGGTVIVETGSNFRISAHNGSTAGLILGNQLVSATGSQINYIAVVPGTAAANKAIVLDTSKNITGINLLSASVLNGVINTGLQPNITSVNILDIASHNASTQGLSLGGVLITASASELNTVDTAAGAAAANKALILDASKNISGINQLSATTINGTIGTTNQPNITLVNTLRIANHDGGAIGLILGSVLVTSTANQLNYTNVVSGIATASKAMVLDSNSSISGVNVLNANALSGAILTASQPNINSVNVLDIVNHDAASQGLSLAGVVITASAVQLNRINITPGTSSANKAMVLDASKNISGINALSAANLAGILTTASQTNIRLLRSINIEDHDGATLGLSLAGVLITATAEQINTLTVSAGTAAPSKALVLNGSSEIAGISMITSTNIYGTIRTAAQPYISSVSALDITTHNASTQGLALAGTLITVSAAQINKLNVSDGNASASKVMILNSSGNITGIGFLAATTLAGTLTTTNQPNINSVNTLNIAAHNGTTQGLSLGGTLITANAAQINYLNTTIGVAFPNKAMILDNSNNFAGINDLSATTISGLLNTGFQPNITTVNTLNILNHDGSQGLKLNGILVAATANQLNYTATVPGTATSGRALVTNDSNSIDNINQLTANRINATQLSLSGVLSNLNTGGVIVKSYSMTGLRGRVVDIQLLQAITLLNFQPAGQTNSYSSEIYGYILPGYSELFTFYVNCADRVRMWVDDVLVLHSWTSISGYRTTSSIFLNANQWVRVYIQFQVDAISASLLNVQWASANTTRANIPTNNLAWDSNIPNNDSNHHTRNSLTIYNDATISANATSFTVDTNGNLVIDASGNNITLGNADNLSIPSHDGASNGLYLGGVLVQPTAYELNTLKVTPGVITASKAVVVDASKSLTGFNSITATSISCTNLTSSAFTISTLTLSGPLNNYNTGGLTIRQFSGPNMTGRLVNVDLLSDLQLTNYDPRGLVNNYSIDIVGYIKPIYTEMHTFYAIANDRVRIFINNTLILNVWDSYNGLEYTSNTIQLTANQWVPIYVQFQNVADASSLLIRWSSTTLTKSLIPVNNMAWDNTTPRIPLPMSVSDSMTLFSSQEGLTTTRSGGLTIDSAGNLQMSTASGIVSAASGNSFNVISHNGSTTGLMLAGVLIVASATEINRLSNIIPGNASALKAMVLDAGSSISGIASITSTDLYGTIRTPTQPYITSLGTVSSTLNITADVLIGSTTLFRLNTNSTTSLISSSVNTTTDSAADLFIGNYGTTPSTSSRKLMIKASGSVGIQTNTPNRTLSVNGGGATYAVRIINNNATGSESNYTDLGTDTSGSYVIAPTGANTIIQSNLLIGASSPVSITNTAGVLNVNSSSLQVGNATGTAMPLEVGSVSFTLSGPVGFLNSSGSTGSVSTPPTSYSIRTSSSIIVNGTVCVASDRRLKTKIQELDIFKCRKFILNSNPVSFAYKKENHKQRVGLIAQEVIQSEFKELVQFTPDEELQADYQDGFYSPPRAAMNVAYVEIVPILMQTIKDLYRQNQDLTDKLNDIYKRLSDHGL